MNPMLLLCKMAKKGISIRVTRVNTRHVPLGLQTCAHVRMRAQPVFASRPKGHVACHWMRAATSLSVNIPMTSRIGCIWVQQLLIATCTRALYGHAAVPCSPYTV